MKRRGFFTAIAGAAAGGTVAASVEPKVTKDPLILPDVIDYNGFTITWTGWKESMYDLCVYGQWIARPKDGKTLVSTQYPWGADGIVSAFPGGVGFFNNGNQFYTGWEEGQQEAVICPRGDHWPASNERRLAAQRHALARIKKFINENC